MTKGGQKCLCFVVFSRPIRCWSLRNLSNNASRLAPLTGPTPTPRHRWGLILYRHLLDSNDLREDSTLDLGAAPHDYATVGGG